MADQTHSKIGRLAAVFAALAVILSPVRAYPGDAVAAEAGSEALHAAVRSGDVDQVSRILEDEEALEHRDTTGQTPLLTASLAGRAEMVGLLLDRGADVQARNRNGLTPLHAAAYAGHLEVAVQLVKHGAQVNDAENAFAITPLHAASEENREPIVALLITAGADLEAKEVNGYTALSRAGWREHWEIAEMLVRAGAMCQPEQKVGEWLHSRCVPLGR